jgi:hypothetical protein
MNAVLDDFLVGAVLIASLGYAAFKLGPASLRKRVIVALSRIAGAAPAFLNLRQVSQRLEAASGKTQEACGACDNCGTESPSVPQSPAEIRVPVGKIGRRS